MTRWPSKIEADPPAGVTADHKGPANVSPIGGPGATEIWLRGGSIKAADADSTIEACTLGATIGVTVTFEEVASRFPMKPSIVAGPTPSAVRCPKVLILAIAWSLVFQAVTRLPMESGR